MSQAPTRCNGNGTSGKREQLVYVHVKGTPDTYKQNLPFILKRLKFDPASASAPFVATLVDVTGLVIYFTAASLILRGALL